MYTTMQNTAQATGGGQTQPTAAPADPRLAMWQQQMRQRRMGMTGQPWGNFMPNEARRGMMGPGIASLQMGATQGPMRMGGAPMTAAPQPMPAQRLTAPQGGINPTDLVQKRRGVLPTGGGKSF